MKKLSVLYAIALLLGILAACSTGKRAEELAFAGTMEVDSTLNKLIAKKEVPGISLAVFTDKGIVFQKSVGIKNTRTGGHVDSLTAFEAASLSKTLFAYVVMRYVEQGSLALEAPVSPMWVSSALSRDPRHKKLTPLNLLSHTAGLPNWRGAPNLAATRTSELFLSEDSLKINFEPGAEFSYSGEGYLYLQQVLEEKAVKDLRALADEEVFAPLQMRHSSFVFDAPLSGNFATGHDAKGAPKTKYKPALPLAAASLHTNAGEYATFLVQLVQEIKAGGAFSQMMEKTAFVEEKRNYGIYWGLGIGLMEFQDKRYLFHWGDNGVFKSYYMYCLEDNIGFVYFANGEKGLAIRNDLNRSVFGYEVPMWPADYVE